MRPTQSDAIKNQEMSRLCLHVVFGSSTLMLLDLHELQCYECSHRCLRPCSLLFLHRSSLSGLWPEATAKGLAL